MESSFLPAASGEFRFPACAEILETFSGKNAFVAYRLTIDLP